jgi:uncharacterized UPF0160 family protein
MQTQAYANAIVVRTRDNAILSKLPIIVDVGSLYSPETNRYDHHQRGFSETFSPKWSIKLSTAGLIYKHFGREIIQTLAPNVALKDLDVVYEKVYETFIAALDGIDNGISQYDTNSEARYAITTDLSSRVSYLNQDWDEDWTKEQNNARFEDAISLTGKEFTDRVLFTVNKWLPARNIVLEAFLEREKVHPSKQIVVLKRFTLWKSHIYSIEDEYKASHPDEPFVPVLYILYSDTSGKWRVQCVSESIGSFNSRKTLPDPWKGIRDNELAKVSDVPDALFVHATGFIGGALTYEGAFLMATKSLEFEDSTQIAKKQKMEE